MFLPTDALIECVPNFSEGNDESVLIEIKQALLSVPTVVLLHIDANKAANRTVFTFVGKPDAVCEAVYRAMIVASQRINMSVHKGTHPRLGALDVCPLIPIQNISIEETDVYAQNLAKRIGEELCIPMYCYEYSQTKAYRRKLEQIRKGEYESLPVKMATEGWEPDYGPKTFNATCGATVIGARHFLIAFNVNLDTKSVDIAKRIAEDIRESGRTIVDTQTGEKISCKGLLQHVKAIGWYISDFDMVQVSTNITNYNETPVYKVLETIKQRAMLYKTKVTGCELVGLIPKKALLDTGAFYAEDSHLLQEKELLETAVDVLNLNSVKPFSLENNVFENALERIS